MAKEVKFGIMPYDDGDGNQINVRIGVDYPRAVDQKEVIRVSMFTEDSDWQVHIPIEEWENFRDAVDRNLKAYREL